MTYRGERARPIDTASARSFEVSKVRIGPDGFVSEVLWGEVDAWVNQVIGHRVVATEAEVVDALHDGAHVMALFPLAHRLPPRPFQVTKFDNGRERLSLSGAATPGRDLYDLVALDD